jgi:hypothetical protein
MNNESFFPFDKTIRIDSKKVMSLKTSSLQHSDHLKTDHSPSKYAPQAKFLFPAESVYK